MDSSKFWENPFVQSAGYFSVVVNASYATLSLTGGLLALLLVPVAIWSRRE